MIDILGYVGQIVMVVWFVGFVWWVFDELLK